MLKRVRKAIQKRGFSPTHADQTPTEGSKQVFAKMAAIPFADPILPLFWGILISNNGESLETHNYM